MDDKTNPGRVERDPESAAADLDMATSLFDMLHTVDPSLTPDPATDKPPAG